jgi:hypothetical protein
MCQHGTYMRSAQTNGALVLPTCAVRDLPFFRAPAGFMIDQLKEVYIDGELEMIDTANWLPKVIRKDYTVGFHIRRSASAIHQYLHCAVAGSSYSKVMNRGRPT